MTEPYKSRQRTRGFILTPHRTTVNMATEEVIKTAFVNAQTRPKKHKKKLLSQDELNEMKKQAERQKQEIMNKLLTKEIMRMKAKRQRDKARRPKRVARELSDKQKAQHAIFKEKVRRARELFAKEQNKTAERWGEIMQKVSRDYKLEQAALVAKSQSEEADSLSKDQAMDLDQLLENTHHGAQSLEG